MSLTRKNPKVGFQKKKRISTSRKKNVWKISSKKFIYCSDFDNNFVGYVSEDFKEITFKKLRYKSYGSVARFPMILIQ